MLGKDGMTLLENIHLNMKLFGIDPPPNTLILSNQVDESVQDYVTLGLHLRVIIAENLPAGEHFMLAYIIPIQ